MRDHLGRPLIVVTGMGIVTSLGAGQAQNWSKLSAGVSGIHRLTRFSTEGLKTTICGSVDDVEAAPFTSNTLTFALAEIATAEALQQARLGQAGDFPGPLVIAVPPVELGWNQRRAIAKASSAYGAVTYSDLMASAPQFPDYYALFQFGTVAEKMAERFGTKGLPISLSTACASGATALQTAADALRRGEATSVLCAATDGSIDAESMIRFSLLSALSTQNDVPEKASKPFSKNRDGFVMAEGAATLVLETYDHAKARGAEILGFLSGCGERADSFHRTRSNPDGKAVIGTIENALSDAGLQPEHVDYINAHGTSTPENDKMEHLAYAAVFGSRIQALPLSSNKSMIGHTLTAAGAIEAVISLMTLHHQLMPPTINYEQPDPVLLLDVVPGTARAAHLRAVMSNSFGFGGQNASLIFTLEPASSIR